MRGADLESDLRARDFTLNAMAVDVHHPDQLLDPLGGSADLAAGRLRACSNTSFQDDPLRIIRAIRGAATYTLHILPETRSLMKAAIAKLPQVSPERQRDELFKLLDAPKPGASLRALDMLGVLPYLLPELPALNDVEQSPPHIWDVWTHTLYTLEKLESVLAALAEEYDPDSADEFVLGFVVLKLGRYRQQIGAHLHTPLNTERSVKALLYLATLYHDVAKPKTRSIDADGRIRAFGHEQRAAEIVEERFNALRLSNAEIERLKRIVRNHMRPHSLRDTGKPPTRRAIYRFFRDTQEAGADVVLLSVADLLATYGPNLPQDVLAAHLDVCRALLEAWFEHREESVLPPAVLDGNDLIVNFDLEPGPIIGELLEAVREAQAMGEIEDRKAAFKFVEEWLQAR
jgi:tRNA nucleotidyltransferase/poly(A) polymerase